MPVKVNSDVGTHFFPWILPGALDALILSGSPRPISTLLMPHYRRRR